jgi:hypothetical protein
MTGAASAVCADVIGSRGLVSGKLQTLTINNCQSHSTTFQIFCCLSVSINWKFASKQKKT